MALTVQELASLLGGQLASDADGSLVISGGAAIAAAEEGHLTFFGNPKYLPQLKACRATAALVPLEFSEEIPPVAIRVENPSLAFATALEKLAPSPVRFAPGVHSTAVIGHNVTLETGVSVQPHAVIEDGAYIGARTVIGAGSYVGHEAQVGSDCRIAPRVTITERCRVGSRVILHSGVVLGADGFGFEFLEGRHVKIPQVGIVQVDDDVEIGANTTVDRARFGRTWVQEGTKIDNLVQIGHNVVIGKHCILCALVGIAGSVRLGDYVTFAGQAGTTGHVEIGEGATIGGQCGVTKDVPANAVMFDCPALPMRDFKERRAHLARLPKLVERVKRVEQFLGAKGKFLPPESNT
ncbi:MAG: UDP-3-O-(3-hydroxymyristoyl)glucosamine N-acyltransferase [Verrucomicrobiota bacterium]|nr:UDP-3-O-(3-hydroxymyristoyl)glucosamine N-acyltransferase [Verrucomicrobiota bacterium]